ncbi:MAG: signal peptidase II [Oscillospiraceae bacterium]|jgi:signal peptidase II|nr:signal peptidase II [Oscillospiraceae bacterium]MBO5917452.1 signal peptidase II [Oscillospiraceae bacterium]
MVYFIAAALLVALDQMVKHLVSTGIPLGGSVPFLPHIMDLTYVQNTGCAFSLLEEHTWLLTLTSAVLSAALAWAVAKKFFRHPLGRSALTLVLAGAVGNLIDRAAYGYVVDMFRTLFMDFAVFNVADICVVVGGIAAAAYYLFLYDKLEGRANEPTQADG